MLNFEADRFKINCWQVMRKMSKKNGWYILVALLHPFIEKSQTWYFSRTNMALRESHPKKCLLNNSILAFGCLFSFHLGIGFFMYLANVKSSIFLFQFNSIFIFAFFHAYIYKVHIMQARQ